MRGSEGGAGVEQKCRPPAGRASGPVSEPPFPAYSTPLLPGQAPQQPRPTRRTCRSSTGTLKREGSGASAAAVPCCGPARPCAAAPAVPAAPTVLAIHVSSPRYQSREARAEAPAIFCWRRRNLRSRKRDLVASVLRSRRATAEGLGSCTQVGGRLVEWEAWAHGSSGHCVAMGCQCWVGNSARGMRTVRDQESAVVHRRLLGWLESEQKAQARAHASRQGRQIQPCLLCLALHPVLSAAPVCATLGHALGWAVFLPLPRNARQANGQPGH